MIVFNVCDRVIGVVVDSVSDVLELDVGNIKPAPQLQSSVDAGYITGMGCIKRGEVERMLILVNIAAMMSSPERAYPTLN